ncbi:MAG: hypothetical protein FIB08_04770 [Candidatus Methanoperedens sp.]|nr:hypothetical protein [Candidatus Methanoperedens sp.]
MEKADLVKLVIGSIFGIAAIILSFYGDTAGVSMMAAAGIAIFSNYFLGKLISKNNIKKDEMSKRISAMSSEFALFMVISTIGVLTITLHFYPSLFDAFEVMAILIAVMILSKIACHWYYKKIKREIEF